MENEFKKIENELNGFALNPNVASTHKKANNIICNLLLKMKQEQVVDRFNELTSLENYTTNNHIKADKLLIDKLRQIGLIGIAKAFITHVDKIYN